MHSDNMVSLRTLHSPPIYPALSREVSWLPLGVRKNLDIPNGRLRRYWETSHALRSPVSKFGPGFSHRNRPWTADWQPILMNRSRSAQRTTRMTEVFLVEG